MRWINRLGTATTLLIIVAGPPLAVAVWVADHRLTWPTRDQLQAWIDRPLTAATIIAGCITVAAIGWLLLLFHLAREAVRTARRRRRHRHLYLPTPAQITASSMAGVAALTLPGLSTGDHPPTPTADTSPEQPASPAPPHHQATDATTGITLPGGSWLPTSTALAVTATASLIWLRRRQHYQPRPPHPDRSTRDHDLQPLPLIVDAITATLPPDPQSASHGGRPPVITDQLPGEIILIDGPGAADAARGMIVTAALAVATGQPARPLHLYRDDLAWLLPDTDPRELTAAGIHLDRPTAREPAQQPEDQTREQPDQSRTPAEPHTTIRLSGDPTATVRWHVARDGTTTGAGITTPHRFCVLDRHAAADLITLVRQALDQPARAAGQSPTSTPTPEPAPSAPPAGSPAPAHLTLIGGCQLMARGTLVRLRRNAGLQILAYLAIHPEGATKTDLIHACWPGQPPATITQRLHTTISDLRRQLHPLIEADPITRTGEHYTLNRQAVDTDLQTWRTAVHTAANAATTEAKLHAHRSLINQYRGDLAAGHHWPWLTPAREALRRDVIDACITAAETAQPSEAAHLLQQALTIDPHNRQLRRRTSSRQYLRAQEGGPG